MRRSLLSPFVIAFALLLVQMPAEVQAEASRTVLVINSFGRRWAPTESILNGVRRKLSEDIAGLDVSEFSLEVLGGELTPEVSSAALGYLHALYDQKPPALIICVGSPAVRFARDYRAALFPDVPSVSTALDVMMAPSTAPAPNEVPILFQISPSTVIGFITDVLPDVRKILLVIGDGQNERRARAVLKPILPKLFPFLTFEYVEGESLASLVRRVQHLPSDQAIIYLSFGVAADGGIYEFDSGLTDIAAAASVPVFAVHRDKLRDRVLGGAYVDGSKVVSETVRIATALLAGERAETLRIAPITSMERALNAGELARWSLDRDRLPPGTILYADTQPVWFAYRWHIVVVVLVGSLQWALIALLVKSRRRMRDEMQASKSLRAKLLTAQEDERRRFARELHDDLSQRLARLAIDAGRLLLPSASVTEIATALKDGLIQMNGDVSAMSYRLHPATLDDLGLEEAVRREAATMARRTGMNVRVSTRLSGAVACTQTALCLYRIAQEALRNVEQHSGARNVEVTLARVDDVLQLAVRDNGRGFDLERAHPDGPHLGLESMRERVELLGGEFALESRSGEGTSVLASVPVPPGSEQRLAS